MRQLLSDKKGQALGNLQSVVIALVTIGIILGVGFLVLEEFRTNIQSASSEGENSTAYEGVNETINAAAKIPTWLGIIVILFIVGIIMAILFSVFPRSSGGI